MSRFSTSLLASALFLPAFAHAQTPSDEDIIIVTASPLDRSIDEAITGQSVLAGDALQDRLAGTLGETLKLEPGVSSTSFGAGASRPIIRGQGGDRVRILTNGIGSIDASSASPDHAVAVEPAQAERIEVLRGAALLRYGSSGAGGVVNTIDGRIPTEFPDGQTDAAIRIGASTVDAGSEAAASLDQRVGDFVLHLDATRREAGDYRIPVEGESRVLLAEEGEEVPSDFDEDRRLDNSFARSNSVTGGLSYIGDRGFIGIAVHDFNTTYGVPGGHGHGDEEHGDEDDHDDEEGHDDDHDHEEEEEEGGVTIKLDQQRIDFNAGWEFDGPIERVQAFGGIAQYRHTEIEGDGEVGTVFKNDGYEIRVEAIQAEKEIGIGNWRAAHGVQYRERDFSAVGEEAFVPPTLTQQLGAYTFHEVEIGKGHIEAAARFERTDQQDRFAGTDKSFDLFSVSGGGDLHVTDAVRIGGTVFRTERAPTTEELFSNGPHLATSQFERGDATLGKEVATGVEAAIRHRENGHNLTLNLFYTDYTDYIFDTAIGDEEDGLPVFQFTAEDAEFYGFEAVGETEITRVGGFDVSADALVEYVRAKTATGNLPRIPLLSVLSGIEAESDRITLRAEWEHVVEANDLAAFELPTEDYDLVNAFVTWKAPVDAQDVELRLSVLNIFDAEARQHTSFLKDLVPLPGRNIRFSISAKL
ncbi:TonB-dependent receptor [Litorimonas cladophorae]|uniref:TonB-dependent receptor n=1 Tax=Litorimonas cladophorae TaxID=1220491 RepID=A0A918KA81_9PROT|nr:TonB-dependent receptor [Litorimonas cladophorae]GGX56512.1 TonB-dependent receptor [Litorimonas cladophorae]